MADVDKYQIKTGEIYEHEYLNWKPGDNHKDLIEDMELKLLFLLQDNGLCGKSEETGHHELYEEKEKEFEQNIANLSDDRFPPFTYFYLSKTKSDCGDVNWIICDYGISYVIQRADEKPDVFEFFFAFKLRQVDLMQLDTFLGFHMKESYNNDKRSYFRFLTILVRKYQILYDEARIKTIDEWMDKGYWSTEDQISAIKDSEKIKWNGKQKELADLFVALKINGWIDEVDDIKIQKAFTKSKTISQILKPSFDRDSKEYVLDQIYSEGYIPKFEKISKCKK